MADSTGKFKGIITGIFQVNELVNPFSSESRTIVTDSVLSQATGPQSLTATLFTNSSVVGGSYTDVLNAPNNLSDAKWTASNIGVTTNVEGVADQLSVGAVNGSNFHALRNDASSLTNGTRYYFRTKIKYISQRWIQIIPLTNGFGGSSYVNFDLVSQTVTASSTVVSSSITLQPDGYCLLEVVADATATTAAGGFAIVFVDSGTAGRAQSWLAASTTSVYVKETYTLTKSNFVHDVSQDADQYLSPTTVTNTSTFGAATVSQESGGDTQDLTPTKADNTSTFGSPTISATKELTATKATNSSTFGTPIVGRGSVGLTSTVLTNTSTFGSAAVTSTKALVSSGVTNSSTFGSATVSSTYPITASKLTNSSTFGEATVGRGAVNLDETKFTNSSTFGAASISTGPVSISVTKFDNTSTFGSSIITSGDIIIQSTNFENNSTFGEATVGRGAIDLSVSKLNNTSTFGSVDVSATNDLSTTNILNENTFGSSDVVNVNDIETSKLNNTSTFGSPAVATGAVNLSVSKLNNTSTFGSSVISAGGTQLIATRLTNSSTFGSATVNATSTLGASKLNNSSTFGFGSVTTSVSVAPTKLVNTTTFGNHIAEASNILVTSKLDNSSTFGSADVSSVANISASRLINESSFGSHEADQEQFISTTIHVNESTFGSHEIFRTFQELTVPKLTNSQTFGTSVVRNGKRLAPFSDSRNTGWFNQDNANTSLYESISEDINRDMEETYVTDTGFGTNTYKFKLAEPDVSITNKNNHRVRYKVRKEVGTTPKLTVRLYQGDIRIAQWIHTDLPTSYTTFERTLTVDQAVMLSGYSNLYIEFVTEY